MAGDSAAHELSSEDEVRKALDRIEDGFAIFDREWHFVYLNKSAERYFGRSRDELLGRVVWEVFPLAVGTEIQSKLVQAAAQREPSEFETMTPTLRRWVSFRVFPSEQRVSVSFRDTTEQRATADALRGTEARYRAFFEHALDGMLQTSPTGEILAANEAACRMLGRTEDELRTLGRAGVIDANDARVGAGLEERDRTGHARIEVRCVRKDGTTFPAEIASSVYLDKEGRERTAMTIRDLSAHKRAEDRLHLIAEAGTVLGSSLDSNATFTSLAQLVVPRMADYCVVDLVEDGHLRRVAGARWEPATHNSTVCVGPPGPVLHDARIEEIARTGEPELVEVVGDKWLREAGRVDPFVYMQGSGPRSAIAVPLAARGKVIGVLSMILNDRGRRYDAADLALARAIADRAGLAIDNARLHEQTIEAKRLRDEVLGIVSHDLRNPLSAILVGTRLLGRKVVAPEVAAITRSVKFANSLIQDLLSAAALEAGTLPLEKSWHDVAGIVDESVVLHRTLAEGRSIAIESFVDPELPYVNVDRRRFVQVLNNLIGNALKFTPDGGRVHVEARSGDR